MGGDKRGNALVMTVLIMAISAIWFTLILGVSANHFRISYDEISRVQADLLARGAMTEAMVRLQQAAEVHGLELLDEQLVEHTDVGMMCADWCWIGENRLRITAAGQTDESRRKIVGELMLVQLPAIADSRQPILYLEAQKNFSDKLQQSAGYHHLLWCEGTGGLVIRESEPVTGELYCLGDVSDGWTVNIERLELPEGLLYIDGHAYLSGTLQAASLVVTGDLYWEENSQLDCSQVQIGGQHLGHVPAEINTEEASNVWENRQQLIVVRMSQ